MNIWPRSEASRANVKFWGQSLSQGHYKPIYQEAGKGFLYFITRPLIFFAIKPRVNKVKKPVVIWWRMRAIDVRKQKQIWLVQLTLFLLWLDEIWQAVLWIYSRNAPWIKNSKTRRFWFIFCCSKSWIEGSVAVATFIKTGLVSIHVNWRKEKLKFLCWLFFLDGNNQRTNIDAGGGYCVITVRRFRPRDVK